MMAFHYTARQHLAWVKFEVNIDEADVVVLTATSLFSWSISLVTLSDMSSLAEQTVYYTAKYSHLREEAARCTADWYLETLLRKWTESDEKGKLGLWVGVFRRT